MKPLSEFAEELAERIIQVDWGTTFRTPYVKEQKAKIKKSISHYLTDLATSEELERKTSQLDFKDVFDHI